MDVGTFSIQNSRVVHASPSYGRLCLPQLPLPVRPRRHSLSFLYRFFQALSAGSTSAASAVVCISACSDLRLPPCAQASDRLHCGRTAVVASVSVRGVYNIDAVRVVREIDAVRLPQRNYWCYNYYHQYCCYVQSSRHGFQNLINAFFDSHVKGKTRSLLPKLMYVDNTSTLLPNYHQSEKGRRPRQGFGRESTKLTVTRKRTGTRPLLTHRNNYGRWPFQREPAVSLVAGHLKPPNCVETPLPC